MGSMLSRGSDRGRGTWFPPFAVNIPSNCIALVANAPGGLRAVTLEGESGERLLEAALRQRVGGQASPTTPEEALVPREERASGSADPLALVSANQPQRRRPGAPMTPNTEAASKWRRGSAADGTRRPRLLWTPGTPRTKSALFKLWCDILAARNLPSLPVDAEKLGIVSSRVELGCIMLNEVELDEWNSLVTISLTVSKTDQYARGCKRTLGCRCNAKEPVVCPFCVAGVLVSHQEVMSGIEHGTEAAADWPLISQEGDPSKLVPKESMLAALKEDAIYLKDMDLVSGHSLRRSGVKHWVKAGVPEELIMFLTRHSSSAVKAYIEDARESSPVVGNLEELTNKIAEEHKNQKQVAHFDADSVKSLLRAYLKPPVVTNLATLKFHATSMSNNHLIPSRWQTACGWCYVAAGQLVKPAASYEEIPTEATPCTKCMNYLPYWAAV
ncbi:Tyr recombinase domain-containing protein [Durusdinium trenchii]|uniref:Tyr recombinase domain-containing protein n=1 Tax=Durusdinium trenchii TaxID=1381693 RepID=A0ABP0SLM9_9DINO